MSSLAKNLDYLMQKNRLSANQLQELAGITQSTTSRILNGETTNPRDSVVEKYAKYFKVSLSDIKYADLQENDNKRLAKEMLSTTPAEFDPTKLPDYRRVDDWDSDTPLDDDEVAIVFYKSLEFACGSGKTGEATDDEWRRLRFSKYTLHSLGIQPSNAFAATARDDSMKPYIEDGDTIFVDKGHTTIKDGKVYAIEHGGLFRCKRLYNLPKGGVRIVSDNHEEYPEIALHTLDDVQEQAFRIIGRVFSVSRLDFL